MTQHSLSLRNKLLVALPSMSDGFFAKSITYICDHSEEGTMGIVINQPLGINLPEIFKQLNLPDATTVVKRNINVLKGGPVKSERGFLLHTHCDQEWQSSMQVSDELTLTASKDALESLALGDDSESTLPEHCLLALGFAGWAPEQLEQEIKEGCWLITDADFDTLFHCMPSERWSKTYQKMGLDPNLITAGGNA